MCLDIQWNCVYKKIIVFLKNYIPQNSTEQKTLFTYLISLTNHIKGCQLINSFKYLLIIL